MLFGDKSTWLKWPDDLNPVQEIYDTALLGPQAIWKKNLDTASVYSNVSMSLRFKIKD